MWNIPTPLAVILCIAIGVLNAIILGRINKR